MSHAQGDHAREEERDRVVASERGLLVEIARDVAVEGVTHEATANTARAATR